MLLKPKTIIVITLQVNSKGVKTFQLLRVNLIFKISLHISTDYVFGGEKNEYYFENDKCFPINKYGMSKYHGEVELLKNKIKNSIIIRTSWLYSKYKKSNFVLKIISRLSQNVNFEVVNNQFGSPTNSEDLVIAILTIIPKINNESTEIFHFSNIGKCSRYEFSTKIEKLLSKNKKSIIMPVICNDEFLKDQKIHP